MANILLFEDDDEQRAFYADALRKNGFDTVIEFSDTRDIVARVEAAYTGPSIMVSDYVIQPMSPLRYLPKLREHGINLPIVIMSGTMKWDGLNQLSASYRIAGFFEKTANPLVLATNLATHMSDLVVDSEIAWQHYELGRRAAEYVKRLTPDMARLRLRILCMEDVAIIARNATRSETVLYEWRKEMKEWLKDGDSLLLQALLTALRAKSAE